MSVSEASGRKRKEREEEVTAAATIRRAIFGGGTETTTGARGGGQQAAAVLVSPGGGSSSSKKEASDEEADKKRILEIVHRELREDSTVSVREKLSELADFCYDREAPDARGPNRMVLDQAGGHTLILHLMAKHGNDAGVQNEGLRALQNPAADDSGGRCERLADAFAVEQVLTGMMKFSEQKHRPVQKHGCGVLLNLSLGSLVVKKRIVAVGGVAALVSAMKRHAECKDIQLWTCLALEDLVELPEGKKAIWEASGGSAIFGALEKHRDDEDIKTSAKATLKALMSDA
jgi:hypothetical protein